MSLRFRRRQIVLISLITIFLLTGGGYYYFLFRPTPVSAEQLTRQDWCTGVEIWQFSNDGTFKQIIRDVGIEPNQGDRTMPGSWSVVDSHIVISIEGSTEREIRAIYAETRATPLLKVTRDSFVSRFENPFFVEPCP